MRAGSWSRGFNGWVITCRLYDVCLLSAQHRRGRCENYAYSYTLLNKDSEQRQCHFLLFTRFVYLGRVVALILARG